VKRPTTVVAACAALLSAGCSGSDTHQAGTTAPAARPSTLGHATLAIYNLAFTGREEDVADQLSAFMLLTPGADGKPYPNGVRIAMNTPQDWKLSAKEAGDASELPFWDGHPMDIQRMYNWDDTVRREAAGSA
jgi:hypothetical protein